MNSYANIIDVTPLDHSSARTQAQDSKTAYAAPSSSTGTGYREPSWTRSSTQFGTPYGTAYPYAAGASPYDQARTSSKRTSLSPLSALGGLAQAVIGAGLVAIGIPMLIFPGPGLISITAGALLVSRGLSKLTR